MGIYTLSKGCSNRCQGQPEIKQEITCSISAIKLGSFRTPKCYSFYNNDIISNEYLAWNEITLALCHIHHIIIRKKHPDKLAVRASWPNKSRNISNFLQAALVLTSGFNEATQPPNYSCHWRSTEPLRRKKLECSRRKKMEIIEDCFRWHSKKYFPSSRSCLEMLLKSK